ncbi:MAG: prephenate dehydratase [Clostridia bacterium]|jgi:prephenate dehydratase|nr:prephenate dehydratase [Clostridia bacterium]
MLKLGYLGPEGTFSEKAAHIWLHWVRGTSWLGEGRTGIPQLFHELEAGELHQIVVPVENSIEGAVNVTQDYLIRIEDIEILGEISLSIEHYLATSQRIPLSEISAVYSHPQALSQCHEYLQNNLKHASLLQATSTAEAARLVAQNAPGIAAVTSKDAVIKYGLTVLAEKIQDFSDNKTRFWVLGKKEGKEAIPKNNNSSLKTSIVVALPYNRPGSLYEILKGFADANLDLTRIESRPTKKELGEYLFIIDFWGHLQDKTVLDTLTKLKTKAAMLKILGSYPIIT